MHRTSAVASHHRVARRSAASESQTPTRGVAVATLQRFLGNAAVARMLAVQRDSDPNQGWSDTTKGWNARRRVVEDIDRIPISGLGDFGIEQKGLTDEERQTDSKHHTTEAAGHRCIALVPKALDPSRPTDVLLHFHGFTNRSSDPYAGWRQRDDGTVRDVEWDRIEAQMKASGQAQTIAILPQGISHSQFGKVPTDPYIQAVMDRLRERGVKLNKEYHVILSAHSGGGNTVIANLNTQAGGKGQHAAEVVLFEAIWEGNQQKAVSHWATTQLDKAYTSITHATNDAEKQEAVDACPVLRAYYSGATAVYVRSYTALDNDLRAWFDAHAAKLGAYADVLKAHFQVRTVGGTNHETLIHGLGGPEAGPLTDALRAEHRPGAKSLLDDGSSATAPAHHSKTKTKTKTRTFTGSDAAKPQAPKSAKHKKAKTKEPMDRAQAIALAIDQAKHGGISKAAQAAVAGDIAHAKNAEGINYDVESWFAEFNPDATFLGLHIRPSSEGEAPGVHNQLAAVLTSAESLLARDGASLEDTRKRLRVRDVGGLRRPKPATGATAPSMHCFGMAVDIDAVDNPFMGNDKTNPHAVEMAERASLLMGGAMQNPLSKPSQAKGHTSASEEDRAARADKAEAQWERLHADSEMLRRYLNLSSDEVASNFAENRQAIAAWQKKHSDSSLAAEPITDPGWWQTQHSADKAHPRGGDLQKWSDPAQHGFMTVQRELVTALVQAGLTWGGMYNTGKDLMHFDLRTGSIRGRPVV